MSLPNEIHQVIAHFLSEFPFNQRRCKTEDYVRDYLSLRLKPEYVDDLLNKYFKAIVSILIDEYNNRVISREILRYRMIDSEGAVIEGVGPGWQKKLRIFQDALNTLSHSDFESLSARILAILGCTDVWVTPQSHDQGLDAFGYADAFPKMVPKEINSQCKIVCLAQAKHYKKDVVGSRDIREFIGSVELAIHKIYSTIDAKYIDLEIKPFGPCIMVFITTEEIPKTVKLISKNAGIFVLCAQDLAMLLLRAKILSNRNWHKRGISSALKRSIQGLQ